MIKIAEILIKTNEHEEFNAGIIYQVVMAYKESDIVFFGHSAHIACMRNILSKQGEGDYNRISFVPIDQYMDEGFDRSIEFIHRYGDINAKMVFCTSNNDILRGLSSFMEANDELEVYVCGHGEIECLTNQQELFLRPRYLFSLKLRTIASVLADCLMQVQTYSKRRKNRSDGVKAWVDFCKSDKSHILLFSEAYRKYGERTYKDTVFNRVEFIHLPYVTTSVNEKRVDISKVRIGCTPRALREPSGFTWKIIKYVIKQAARCNKDFVFSFFVHYHPSWTHVETFGAGKESNSLNWWKTANDRNHFITFMEKCDYILIPYSEAMYILSSSGIMADAVQHETPVLMFQSHCFDDYEKWDVGKRAYTVKGMGELIISEINTYSIEKMRLYKKDLQKCKMAFEEHNINAFRQMHLDNALC